MACPFYISEMNQPLYKTYRNFIKEKFGEPVLKVTLNGGFSCPNRDGVVSTGGCSFCENRAFSRAHDNLAAVTDQMAFQIEKNKHRFNKFIAYLQPFTNTYGKVEELEKIYEPLIGMENVVGLTVGTRPDCLDENICNYLQDVSKRTFLSVEVGLQSASDTVLALNNRGHTFKQFVEAIGRLEKRGIESVSHVMIGLPGEREEDIFFTADQMAALPVSGVKIHQLMVVEDTEIENLFKKGELEVLSLEKYADYVSKFIAKLRPDQYLHRIMADSTKEHGLIAPLWSSDKLGAINYIRNRMQESGLFQGSLYKGRV